MKISSIINTPNRLGICIIVLTSAAIAIYPIIGESLWIAIGIIALLAVIAVLIMTGYEVLKAGIRKFAEFRHSPSEQWKKGFFRLSSGYPLHIVVQAVRILQVESSSKT